MTLSPASIIEKSRDRLADEAADALAALGGLEIGLARVARGEDGDGHGAA